MTEVLVAGWILAWGDERSIKYSEPFPTAQMCEEAKLTLPDHYFSKGCFYVNKDGEKQGRKF
ncbi:MAG: hypothetical protein Unbinned3459contig1002_29 [Prokaryotic dsDNA virus sp.]|nr:MAG: hypothetical protein Unbinned3459contig1002_29 [Prokaryotic dsDNA virus sp.]